MKLKYKIPIIILPIVILTTIVIAYFSYLSNQDFIQSSMKNELLTGSRVLLNAIQNTSTRALQQASFVANLPTVETLMKEKNRDELKKLILPAYHVQHDRFGVNQSHFYSPPAFSFLRTIVSIDQYGEDLSSTRPLIVQSGKEQKPLEGIEISPSGLSIRGVDIIKNENDFVGLFEVQMSFEEALQILKSDMGFEGGAFINEDLMSKYATLVDKPDKERIIAGYRNIQSTDWDMIKSIVNEKLLKQASTLTTKVETVNGELDGILLVPLKDYKGDQIGAIVAVKNFENYDLQLKAALVKSIAFMIIQAVILSGIILITFNALLMRPTEYIDKCVKDLNEGKTDFDISYLAGKDDEIGLVAKSVEKFKSLFPKKEQNPPLEEAK